MANTLPVVDFGEVTGQCANGDYAAKDGEQVIGRVYKHHSTGWVLGDEPFGPGINRRSYDMSGNADTKDEAAALVERCYEACKVR
jgi:hypothetical protein